MPDRLDLPDKPSFRDPVSASATFELSLEQLQMRYPALTVADIETHVETFEAAFAECFGDIPHKTRLLLVVEAERPHKPSKET